MADQTAFDPLALWRQALTKWEQDVNKLSSEALGSPDTTRLVNQFMSASLQMQQGAAEAMTRSLQAMNLPTRTEMVAISDRLAAVEDLLRTLVGVLQGVAGTTEAGKGTGGKPSGTPASELPRTRKPPAAVS